MWQYLEVAIYACNEHKFQKLPKLDLLKVAFIGSKHISYRIPVPIPESSK